MRWFKGYTRIKVRNSANIEGDPDGATVMPLTLSGGVFLCAQFQDD